MDRENKDKIGRVLGLHSRLMNGYTINKAEEALRYGVNERSIQRDIDDIRSYLDTEVERTGLISSVIYDRSSKGYRLEQIDKIRLTNSEVLAVCKILLDSRAFTKKEMQKILRKLIDCCVPRNNQKLVTDLISNEEYHYIELQHKTAFMDNMWEIGQAIQQNKCIEIDYQRMKDKAIIKYRIKPMAIMFSEYYFYVTAYIDDGREHKNFSVLKGSSPTVYRLDRIKKLKVTDDHFRVPYNSRFEEGEFRKRMQFMYSGKLQKVKFKYSGSSIEAVLDRLPTAKILDETDGVYTVSAEVFGKGVDMWLRSQGENVEMME